MFLVVGNVFIDNDASVVTLSISSRGFVSPVFSGAHKDKVYVHTFIVVSVWALWASVFYCANLKKLKIKYALNYISHDKDLNMYSVASKKYIYTLNQLS